MSFLVIEPTASKHWRDC